MRQGLKCWIIGELIGQYMENQLSEKENKVMLNHVQSCNRCKRELQGMKRLKEILITASDLSHRPDAFWKEIENNITREISSKVPTARSAGAKIPMLFQDILYDFKMQPALTTAIIFYSIFCSIAQLLLH